MPRLLSFPAMYHFAQINDQFLTPSTHIRQGRSLLKQLMLSNPAVCQQAQDAINIIYTLYPPDSQLDKEPEPKFYITRKIKEYARHTNFLLNRPLTKNEIAKVVDVVDNLYKSLRAIIPFPEVVELFTNHEHSLRTFNDEMRAYITSITADVMKDSPDEVMKIVWDSGVENQINGLEATPTTKEYIRYRCTRFLSYDHLFADI
jgi:hypothetical protein